MGAAAGLGPAAAHNIAAMDDHAADGWVGVGLADSALGQRKGGAHQAMIELVAHIIGGSDALM
jgi:hypothetical protein